MSTPLHLLYYMAKLDAYNLDRYFGINANDVTLADRRAALGALLPYVWCPAPLRNLNPAAIARCDERDINMLTRMLERFIALATPFREALVIAASRGRNTAHPPLIGDREHV
jgi:hypothetical protein